MKKIIDSLQSPKKKANFVKKKIVDSKFAKSCDELVIGQTLEIKDDIKYDCDMESRKESLPKRFFAKQEYVRKRIEKVFERHGAVQMAVPQLTPKGQSLMALYEKKDNIVKVRF